MFYINTHGSICIGATKYYAALYTGLAILIPTGVLDADRGLTLCPNLKVLEEDRTETQLPSHSFQAQPHFSASLLPYSCGRHLPCGLEL
jgi:hypothetical protein